MQLSEKTWQKAKVIDVTNNPRSYKIITETERIFIQNRRFLKLDRKQNFVINPEIYYDSLVSSNVTPREIVRERAEIIWNDSMPPPDRNVNPDNQRRAYIRKKVTFENRTTRSGRNVKPPDYLNAYVVT